MFDLMRRLATDAGGAGVSRRAFFRAATASVGLVTAASLLAACGGGAATATSTAPSTKAPAAPAAGKSGATGTLQYGADQDISNLDPSTGYDYSIGAAHKAVYDTLFQYVDNPPKLAHVLCESYSSDPEGTQWTFHLYPNAHFQDGSPLQADAVVYSWQRTLALKQGAAFMWLNIVKPENIRALDPHTVSVKLDAPFAPLLLTLPWLFIVNPTVAKAHAVNGDEGEGWLKTHAAGSGPFKITKWEIGSEYDFVADSNYWKGWDPAGHLSGFVWKIMRESSTRKVALQTGNIDFADTMAVQDIKLLQAQGFEVNEKPGFSSFSVKLNNGHGYTANEDVRKAINYAFDYNAALEALQGWATLLEGPLPSNCPYWKSGLKVYRTDMTKAKAALARSPWPNGGFALEYAYVTGIDFEQQFGLILLNQLSKLNIKVNITPLVWPDLVARFAKVDTSPDMAAVSAASSYADPDNFMYSEFYSSQAGSWSNASWYRDAASDKLIEAGRSTVDHTRRATIYAQLQQRLLDQAVEVFVHNSRSTYVWSKKVLGYDKCPMMSVYMYPLRLQQS